MGQTIQQRQLATLERAHAANAVRFNVVLNREQANAVLGRFIDAQGAVCGMTWAEERAGGLDKPLQDALDAIREALHAS